MIKVKGIIVKIMLPLPFVKPKGTSFRDELITSIVFLVRPDEVAGKIWESFCIDGILLCGMSITSENYEIAHSLAMKVLLTNQGEKVEVIFRGLHRSKTSPNVVIFSDFINLSYPYLNKI